MVFGLIPMEQWRALGVGRFATIFGGLSFIAFLGALYLADLVLGTAPPRSIGVLLEAAAFAAVMTGAFWFRVLKATRPSS
jgi:hypothetical protein